MSVDVAWTVVSVLLSSSASSHPRTSGVGLPGGWTNVTWVLVIMQRRLSSCQQKTRRSQIWPTIQTRISIDRDSDSFRRYFPRSRQHATQRPLCVPLTRPALGRVDSSWPVSIVRWVGRGGCLGPLATRPPRRWKSRHEFGPKMLHGRSGWYNAANRGRVQLPPCPCRVARGVKELTPAETG